MKFQYSISNIDMKPIYRELHKDLIGWPEFIVMDELEDGSDILSRRMENEELIYYVRNSDNIVQILKHEWITQSSNEYAAYPFEEHQMTKAEIGQWTIFSCKVADILDIRCPQIVFTADNDAGNSAGQGLICLPDSYPDIDLFIAISHELRHEWQFINRPEILTEPQGEIESEIDLQAYYNSEAEVDAEAFAYLLANKVFNINLFHVDSGDNRDHSILEEHAKTIDFKLDNEDYLFLKMFVESERFIRE